MAKFSSYVKDLDDAKYREFVEERLAVLGHSVEKLARLLECHLVGLPDPEQTAVFKERYRLVEELRGMQTLMQTRFTGD